MEKASENKAAQKDTTKAMVKQLLDETRKLHEEVGYVRALLAAQQNARYEYHVEVVKDTSFGSTSIQFMDTVFAKMQEDGWRLVQAFTNEVGVFSAPAAINGHAAKTNATLDQVILIFERRVS